MAKKRKVNPSLIVRPCCQAFTPALALYKGSVRVRHERGCRRG